MEYMLRYANVLCVEQSACGSLSPTVLATLESSPAKVDFIIILLVSSSLCLITPSACVREGSFFVCFFSQQRRFRFLLLVSQVCRVQ